MLSRLSAISGIAARQYTSQNSLLRAGTLSAYKSPFHTSPHNMVMDKIVYTHADEAPALATYSLLPIIQRFAKPLGVSLNKIINTSFHCFIRTCNIEIVLNMGMPNQNNLQCMFTQFLIIEIYYAKKCLRIRKFL